MAGHQQQHPIPPQEKGKQSDTIEKIEAPDPETAARIFREAKERLFDVSNWGTISKGISASFVLTDSQGNKKQGPPLEGDHFRIDIPGPGPSAGGGYDWVKVELVEDGPGDREQVTIRVRPSADPRKKEGTAHFFKDDATSSFIVKREDNTVYAEVHGRNEEPNTTSEKITDKIRNTVTGIGAGAGLSTLQWQKLVKGILGSKEP